MHLLAVPTEILCMILEYVALPDDFGQFWLQDDNHDRSDIFNARLTCKKFGHLVPIICVSLARRNMPNALAAATLRLDSWYLDRLDHVSRHPVFSRAVQQLVVHVSIDDIIRFKRKRLGDVSATSPAGELEHELKKLYCVGASYKDIFSTHPAGAASLSAAIGRLVNLKRVCLKVTKDNSANSPYGWVEATKTLRECLNHVLSAMTLPLHSFHFNRDTRMHIPDIFIEPLISTFMKSATSIGIRITGCCRYGSWSPYSASRATESESTLKSLKNVKKLSMRHDHEPFASGHLGQNHSVVRATPRIWNPLFRATFPKLEFLELVGVSTPLRSIQSFLSRHHYSLRELRLIGCGMSMRDQDDMDRTEYTRTEYTPFEQTVLWMELLEHLRKSMQLERGAIIPWFDNHPKSTHGEVAQAYRADYYGNLALKRIADQFGRLNERAEVDLAPYVLYESVGVQFERLSIKEKEFPCKT